MSNQARDYDDDRLHFGFIKYFSELQRRICKDNTDKGFKPPEVSLNPLYVPTKIMLMVTELAEAVEAHRKGGISQMDDHLPEREALTCELADTIIRAMDLAGDFGLPLGEVICEKLEFNRSRPVRHGGKAY